MATGRARSAFAGSIARYEYVTPIPPSGNASSASQSRSDARNRNARSGPTWHSSSKSPDRRKSPSSGFSAPPSVDAETVRSGRCHEREVARTFDNLNLTIWTIAASITGKSRQDGPCPPAIAHPARPIAQGANDALAELFPHRIQSRAKAAFVAALSSKRRSKGAKRRRNGQRRGFEAIVANPGRKRDHAAQARPRAGTD